MQENGINESGFRDARDDVRKIRTLLVKALDITDANCHV